MDAATLGAVGSIIVGLAAAGAAVIGHRSAAAATQSGAVLGGYSTLVDNLQEERDTLRARLAEAERLLAAERAEKAALQVRVTELTAENERLRGRIVEPGGQPT